MNHTSPLKDRVDYLLQEWVNENSYIGNTQGIQKILDVVEAEALSLGLYSEKLEPAPSESVSGLKISLVPSADQNPGLIQLILTSKAYTQFDSDSPLQLITWAGGRNRAIGPGVLSAKSALLIGLLVMERAQKIPEAQFNVNLLVFGSPKQEEIFWQKKPPAHLILPLDPAAPDRSLRHSSSAEAIAQIAAKLILHHEKKSPAQIALIPGISKPTDPPLLMGLGPVGTGPYTSQETLEVPSIFSRADIISDVWLNLIS